MMDHKQIQTLQNHCAEQNSLSQEQALDPAVERVRKKLMRLMIISISITLMLILAVLFGVIYKIMATSTAPKQTNLLSSHNITQETIYHTLSLPKGTQILSQSLSEHNVALKILTSDNQTKFVIYNYYTGKLIAVLSVGEMKETSPFLPH